MSRRGPIRVLLVEDELLVREALAAYLASEPELELVGAAGDADAALAAAREERPHVAVTDVRMPGGGPELVRAIHAASPETRVLALSGDDDPETMDAMREAGVVGYLIKGSPIEGIVAAIARAADDRAELPVDRLARRDEPEARIRRLLADDSALEIVFQPICDLQVGETVGVEALSRFPDGGPERWFADAAAAGLRCELELLAVRRALQALEELSRALYLTINVSPETVADPAFVALLEGSNPARVVAEVSAQAPAADYRSLAAPLERLRRRGLRVAIDDADDGLPFDAVAALAPDFVKLERALVDGIDRDASLREIASGVVGFAEGIGASVVAEGIEQHGELDTLAELGVDYGQGFFIARPGPLRSSDELA